MVIGVTIWRRRQQHKQQQQQQQQQQSLSQNDYTKKRQITSQAKEIMNSF
jgi:hypothetical protein